MSTKPKNKWELTHTTPNCHTITQENFTGGFCRSAHFQFRYAFWFCGLCCPAINCSKNRIKCTLHIWFMWIRADRKTAKISSQQNVPALHYLLLWRTVFHQSMTIIRTLLKANVNFSCHWPQFLVIQASTRWKPGQIRSWLFYILYQIMHIVNNEHNVQEEMTYTTL